MPSNRERVLTVFAGEERDRVPIWEIGIDHPTSTEVLGRRPFCRNKLKFYDLLAEGTREDLVYRPVEEQIEIYEKLRLDILPIRYPVFPLEPGETNPNWVERIGDRSFKIDLPGNQWRVLRYNEEADTRTEMDSSIKRGGVDSFQQLIEGLEEPFEIRESHLDQLNHASELSDGRFMVIGREIDVRLPFDSCWFDLFLKWMISEPDLVQRYIDAHLRRALQKLDLISKTEIDGVTGGVDRAYKKGTFFSPKHFRRFVFPALERIVQRCHRNFLLYIKHTDGNINKVIEELADTGIDGYQAIEP